MSVTELIVEVEDLKDCDRLRLDLSSDDDASWPRLAAHNPAWWDAIRLGLGHSGYLITDRDGDRIAGMLPLVLVKGPIFGSFLVSLPYINTGGVWASDTDAATRLIDRACQLADDLDVKYLELRHELPVEHPRLNFQRTEKVHMRLPLPATDDLLDKSFKSKLRSQVRKADQSNHRIAWGGRELLDHFYNVFAVNMRDLGTPVFSKGLFAKILDAFAGDAELCVVSGDRQPRAAALLVHADGVTEVPSASCLRSQNHTGANMWMYRHLLRRAIERGSHTFDFGRSSLDSGTHRFKAQWGAVPTPAIWQYYVRNGDVDAMRPNSQANQRRIKIWQKLPVWLTKSIGPSIVRGIP
ncbi:FemAB family XrtA/PEP-CTERM system-associated protein [Rosistilla ulvae]|uniref:FemAB family XrtA/PEP-CTERM system-associated protein n=1 Tax=Rosistilla ulvae TaxID=1930277 RepID=UPI001FECA119|nr:FemAB family XrtA/PEP-CTERM system-associated protein [Rosistilla ulvae]